MYNFLLKCIIFLSILIIIFILIKSNRNNSAISAFSGVNNNSFLKNKIRGIEFIIQNFIIVLSIIWLVLLFLLSFIKK